MELKFIQRIRKLVHRQKQRKPKQKMLRKRVQQKIPEILLLNQNLSIILIFNRMLIIYNRIRCWQLIVERA